jgi:predicted ribosome quality control (RQC) complex YloA/Tae2 family protein
MDKHLLRNHVISLLMRVSLDLNKSPEENASSYFDKAKRLKKKLEGASVILERMEKKRKREERILDAKPKQEAVVDRKKEWYEKFRWFRTSEGFLVIGGRDATSNEIIIKKHTEKGDLVFHTDMAGSPFFVIKKEKGKGIGDASIKEAANATCSFSRAWKLGLKNSDVFHVGSDQVTKEANAGEYLQKGSFMIKGKTTYVDNEVDVAIGSEDGAIMAGPKSAVAKHCEKTVTIIQGDDKPSSIAKKVRSRIGGDLDEIIRALPSGGMKIAK